MLLLKLDKYTLFPKSSSSKIRASFICIQPKSTISAKIDMDAETDEKECQGRQIERLEVTHLHECVRVCRQKCSHLRETKINR